MNKKVIKIIFDKNNIKIETSKMRVMDCLYALSEFVESLKSSGFAQRRNKGEY